MYYRTDKKGVTAVFLTIIAGAVLSCVIVFIQLAASAASVSYCGNLFNLAGRSVLSEFDLELKSRYGIIAFTGDNSEIVKDLKRYVKYTITDDRYIRLGEISVDLKDYCLMDCGVFDEQIAESINYKNLIGTEKTEGPVATGSRTLRNSRTINSLPSKGMDDTPSVHALVSNIKNLGSISELWKNGSREYLTTVYIFSVFKSGMSAADEENSFFRNEIEYIIEGKKSDEANRRAVKADLLKLRTLLNTGYIYSQPNMVKEALMLAEVMTPGPEAVITQTALIAAWALAESELDVKTLDKGEKVPIIKDPSSWKTDIHGKVKTGSSSKTGSGSKAGSSSSTESGSKTERGYDYEGYLKILLTSLEKEVKLTRMMDLIQINLQGTYNGDFYIKDCYRGFKFEAQVNGRKMKYDEKY